LSDTGCLNDQMSSNSQRHRKFKKNQHKSSKNNSFICTLVSADNATQVKRKRGRPKKVKHPEKLVLRAAHSTLEKPNAACQNADGEKKWICSDYRKMRSFTKKIDQNDVKKNLIIEQDESSIHHHLHDNPPVPITSIRRKVGRPKKRRNSSDSVVSAEQSTDGAIDSELGNNSNLCIQADDAIPRIINLFPKRYSKRHQLK
jgi:hypothetical protein